MPSSFSKGFEQTAPLWGQSPEFSEVSSNEVFTLPGKTFLVGEYAVLAGGPCLLAATIPGFHFRLSGRNEGPFHPASPAGQLLRPAAGQLLAPVPGQLLAPVSGDLTSETPGLEFRDDVNKKGFGRSSAEFIAAYFAQAQSQDWKKTWARFREVTAVDTGYPPSGADIVAQMNGFFTAFDPVGARATVHRWWPFPEWGFSILSTGFTAATHESLRAQPSFPHANLVQISTKAVAAFAGESAEEFFNQINFFQAELEHLSLSDERVVQMIRTLRSLPGMRVAKGCGACGRDTIFCVYEMSERNFFRAQFKEMNLFEVASELNLSAGFST